MIKNYFLLILLSLCTLLVNAQQFFRLGNDENVQTEPLFGILLAGGATDNNDGMKWLAARANGGDVVVLRASGGDGYNNYILNQLGEEINSVTTIVITSAEQANNPAVCEAVNQAEMVFIAGGNQWNYYSHWKGTCLHIALNHHVNEKNAPIGGTSAGLAVLGEVVYTAQSGSVWSDEALANPYHFRVKLSKDFLQVPFMENIVTDSHYNAIYGDDNNRHGRHMAFMARMMQDWDMNARGIGVNEYTAVGVDENGIARVFGHPSHSDYAYFLQANAAPEVCQEGQPLTWSNNQNAVRVYRIKGNIQGSNSFNLSNWSEGNGGDWWAWYVEEGELFQIETPDLNAAPITRNLRLNLFPNPASQFVRVESPLEDPVFAYSLFDISGQKIRQEKVAALNSIRIDLDALPNGVYLLYVYFGNQREAHKIIKQ